MNKELTSVCCLCNFRFGGIFEPYCLLMAVPDRNGECEMLWEEDNGGGEY